MSIRIFQIMFLLSVSATIGAQNKMMADTSYSVHSAYEKYVKKFPDIHIVKPPVYDNVIEEDNIVYKHSGDRNLHLDAFIEDDGDIKPAVVLIHGGGWKSGNKSHMKPMALSLASKGYACFAIEYRLSPEAIYPAAVFDIKNAIKFIKAHAMEFNIDTNQVAVVGCSSGGQLAALIGTTIKRKEFEGKNDTLNQSASVEAIIDIDGILAFKHPESEEGASAAQWLGGTYEEKPGNWRQASALTHVDSNTPPMLFINSKFRRFHAGRDDMIKILKKYNTYYEVKEFEDSPHTFWLFDPWFDPTVDYITDFLNKVFNN